tara:strand:+ start:62 stop:373 length:312 start_codon:yes stop_codon:yes gene_type:complete
MKKIVLILMVFLLVVFTSITKNSTKTIENKIYNVKENLRVLSDKHEMVLLEFNYLSSPKKLMEYQSKYFEDELEEIDILNLQEISLKNNKIKTKSFLINKFTE